MFGSVKSPVQLQAAMFYAKKKVLNLVMSMSLLIESCVLHNKASTVTLTVS